MSRSVQPRRTDFPEYVHALSVHNRCIYPVPGTLALCCHVPTCPGTWHSMQSLFVGSHLWARASFRQLLTDLPLPWASGYPSVSGTPTEDFHPIRSCPCRAYITAKGCEMIGRRIATVDPVCPNGPSRARTVGPHSDHGYERTSSPDIQLYRHFCGLRNVRQPSLGTVRSSECGSIVPPR